MPQQHARANRRQRPARPERRARRQLRGVKSRVGWYVLCQDRLVCGGTVARLSVGRERVEGSFRFLHISLNVRKLLTHEVEAVLSLSR